MPIGNVEFITFFCRFRILIFRAKDYQETKKELLFLYFFLTRLTFLARVESNYKALIIATKLCLEICSKIKGTQKKKKKEHNLNNTISAVECCKTKISSCFSRRTLKKKGLSRYSGGSNSASNLSKESFFTSPKIESLIHTVAIAKLVFPSFQQERYTYRCFSGDFNHNHNFET